ncbi:hypothetical protein PspLS_08209 [Pyricularia sp. CBS 133598]|nr:hypothetical protein PspLS_08209 [Pyricularia sp. CBS 133598]
MAESSRGPSGQDGAEPDETVAVDLAVLMRDNAERLGFDFDPNSDSDSDLVSPVSDFTEEDYNAARAECRQLDLQGSPADYYIEHIAMPRKDLVVRKKRVAQRERRISRHHPKVDAEDCYKYQNDYAEQSTDRPALEPVRLEEDLQYVPRDLVDRRITLAQERQRLERREWEAGKYEYVVFHSKKDPTYFLRQHDKLKTRQGKLEEKLVKASDVREEALAAVKELPVVQQLLEKARAEMKSLDDMIAYENRRATDLEQQMQELQQKDKDVEAKIKLYRDRETGFQDILRDEKHELEQEITQLESRLYPLEESMPLKEQRIEALEYQAKKDLETIKELTDYGDKTTKSLAESKLAEAVSREQAQFYNEIYDASNEAANFHASEAETAKAKEKEARVEAKLVDQKYENAKSQIGELDGQLAEALQKFRDAEEEVHQVKAELQWKEEELARVNHELELVYREDRRVSVSTNTSGGRGYTNLQDELDQAGSDQFSEPSKSPTVSSLRARLAELQAEVESKSTEVDDHKTKLEAKETEVSKAYKQLKEKATEINNLAHTVKELTADNEQLRASAEKGRKDHAAKSSEDEDKYAKLYHIHDSLKKDCLESCQKITVLTERLEDKVVLIKKQLGDSHCALQDAVKDSAEKTKELARINGELASYQANASKKHESLSRNFGSLNDQFKQISKENQAHVSKIAKLEQDLAARPDAAQLASLQADRDAMEDLYKDIKATLSDASNENDLLKADRHRLSERVKDLNRDVSALIDERDQLADDLDVSIQRVSSLQGERNQLARNLDASTQEVARLNGERDQLAKDLESQVNEINSLKDARDQMEKDLEASTGKAAGLENERDKQAKKLDDLGEEIASLKDERDRVTKELQDLRPANDTQAEKDADASKLTKELDHLRAANARLELWRADNGDAPRKLLQKGTELAEIERKLTESQMNNAAKLAEINELRSNINTRNADVQTLGEQLEAAKKQAAELDTSNADLKNQLAASKHEAAKTSFKTAELNERIAELEEQLQTASQNSDGMEAEIAQLRNQLEALTLSDSAKYEEASVLEEKLKQANDAAAAMEATIALLKKQLEAATGHTAELESKLTQLEEQLEAIKGTSEDDLAKSNDRVAELEARIIELEHKLQAAEQERSRLQDELTKSNDRAAELESKTAGLEEQLKQQEEIIRNHLAKVDEATEIATKATDERLDAVNNQQETFRKLQAAKRRCFLYQERVDSLECDIYMAEGKHAEELTEHQAEKQAEIDELKGKIAELRDEIARLEENQMDANDLARFVDTMEVGFDDLEQAKEQAEEAVVARDEHIKELEAELETTKQIATDMGMQLYDMESEIKNLQESRDKSDAAAAPRLALMANIRTRLQELLQQASDCRASVEQKVGNLNTLLQESRDSAAQGEQQLDAMKDKLTECGTKLLAEEAKNARQAGEITELEQGRAKDCEANLAKVQQLEVDLQELRNDVATRIAKEKELEDLVNFKEGEIQALEANKQQSDEQSQRILELQKSLADITDQQTQNGQASVVAAQELQTKLDETKAINDQLVKDLMALTDKAATWEVKEKDFEDLVQLQVQTVKALQDQLKQTTLQYRAIVRRSMGDAAIIQTLRADTSKVWSDLIEATRENASLRQKLKDLEGQEKAEPPKAEPLMAESLCYTCGRGCKCPIAVPEAFGFFDQWMLVFMAIWAFLKMMPKNMKAALSYLLGLLGLPSRCWRPLASRAKSWYRKRQSSSNGKTRAAEAPGDPDWDWPTAPVVPHAAMVYCIIFWAVVFAIVMAGMSFWATSVERHLWLRANTDTRAYFNFGRREGAPGACLVPQLLPVNYRFVYEPTYGNFCDFVERQTGYALC